MNVQKTLLIAALLSFQYLGHANSDAASVGIVATPALRMERHARPGSMRAYELVFFRDGSSRFVGKDGVRLLGVAGTAGPKEERLRHYQERGITPPPIEFGWLNASKNRVRALLSQAEALSRANGGLQVLAPSGQLERADVTLELFYESGAKERVSFSDDPSVDPRLRELATRIQALYERPKDFVPVPVFFADPTAILFLSHTWPNGRSNMCVRNAADYVVILYENGRISISGSKTPGIDAIAAYPTFSDSIDANEARRIRSLIGGQAAKLLEEKEHSKVDPPPRSRPVDDDSSGAELRIFFREASGQILDLSGTPSIWHARYNEWSDALKAIFEVLDHGKRVLPDLSEKQKARCRSLPAPR